MSNTVTEVGTGTVVALRPETLPAPTPPPSEVPAPLTTAQLAENIRRTHREVIGALSHAAAAAIRTGDFLIEAKGRLKHGEFGDYVTLECGLKESTARLYMKLAKNKDKLSQLLAANQQCSSGLSQAQMLRFLSSASEKPKRKAAKSTELQAPQSNEPPEAAKPNEPQAAPKSRWRWWRR
jgi:hypothetical protein